MYGEYGFKAVHKTVHLVKFIGRGCSIFFRERISSYLVLQDIKNCMVPTWPHNDRTNLYSFKFVLMVFFSDQRNSPTGLREALTHSIFSLAISVLEYYTAMFQCIECYLTETELGIR